MDIYTGALWTVELNFASESAVEIALHHYKRRNVDFADCAHAALAGAAAKASFHTSTAKPPVSLAPWRSDTLPGTTARQ
ncbi:hypothetical protein [Paraburkholderia caribensis]|uniref:hypothetical protein n=1 Tax=Paraburkholderia caribensis TaxID=75105 RepID=UPI000AA27EA4|nr:hypothetical protein [Paraburkholderia caribensis]